MAQKNLSKDVFNIIQTNRENPVAELLMYFKENKYSFASLPGPIRTEDTIHAVCYSKKADEALICEIISNPDFFAIVAHDYRNLEKIKADRFGYEIHEMDRAIHEHKATKEMLAHLYKFKPAAIAVKKHKPESAQSITSPSHHRRIDMPKNLLIEQALETVLLNPQDRIGVLCAFAESNQLTEKPPVVNDKKTQIDRTYVLKGNALVIKTTEIDDAEAYPDGRYGHLTVYDWKNNKNFTASFIGNQEPKGLVINNMEPLTDSEGSKALRASLKKDYGIVL